MKILIADDDSVNRRILASFLVKWGHDVEVAVDGTEAWKILQREHGPRFAILDWMMPGMDGAQVCRAVRKGERGHYTYVILLTAKFQKSEVVAGLDAGADDYITKPFDAQELRARLRSGTRILELEEKCGRQSEQLKYEALHDSLTGLWNRKATEQLLARELARTDRYDLPLTIIMGDLDHFKAINDTSGHAAGDAVLRATAKAMQACLRPYDVVGRYGGEEFLFILPRCDPGAAEELGERVRRAVESVRIPAEGDGIRPTISLGVATFQSPASSADLDLLKAADEALYRAKAAGRNRVEIAIAHAIAEATAEGRETKHEVANRAWSRQILAS